MKPLFAVLILVFIQAVLITWLLMTRENTIVVHTPQQEFIHPPPPPVVYTTEFRGPPLKEYKPPRFQQMGLLINDAQETLPLYGREVPGRRDSYHYYTTTPGQQIYPLSVSLENRDCMDDIGCREMYGNESVNVLGKNDAFQTKIYRTGYYA